MTYPTMEKAMSGGLIQLISVRFAALFLTVVVLPLAVLTSDAGEAFAKKKAVRGSLTIKVSGVASGSRVEIGIKGPKQKGAKAFRASLSSAKTTTLRGLRLGRYTIKAKEVEVSGVIASPDKPVQVIVLTKKRPKGSIQVSFRLPSTSPAPPSASTPGQTPAPAQPSPGATPQPLRFNIAGAVGLAKTDNVTQSSRSGRGGREVVPASNLQAVYPSGEVRNAITSGRASAQTIIPGPNEKVFLVFGIPVNLEDASQSPEDFEWPPPGQPLPPNLCFLVEVDLSTGIPRCVDYNADSLAFPSSFSEAIQVGPDGTLYYLLGTEGPNQTAGPIELWKQTPERGLIRLSAGLVPNTDVYDYFVLPDSSVLVGGVIQGPTWRPALQYLPLSGPGSLVAESSFPFSLIRQFSDGKIYTNVYNRNGVSGDTGIARLVPGAGTLEPALWLGPDSATPPPVNDQTALCGPPAVLPESFCPPYSGAEVRNHISVAGKDVATTAGGFSTELVELYPHPSAVPTLVTNVSDVIKVGDRLLIAGVNGSGQNVLTAYDPVTEVETLLLGPDEYEVYNLVRVSTDRVLFDAQRFSPNAYVLGQVDLQSLSVSELGPLGGAGGRWQEFRGLP